MLGEAAGADFDLFDGIFEGGAAFEKIDDLFVAEGLACLLAEPIGLPEAADFVDEAGVDHGFDAGVDAVVDGLDGPVEADDEGVGAGAALMPFILEVGEAAAGELVDFNGADGAFMVVGVDPGGGFGVDLFEACSAFFRGHGLQVSAEFGVRLGAVEESFEEGLYIKVCPPHHYRPGPPGPPELDFGNCSLGGGEPGIDAEAVVVGIDEVKEVMGSEGLFFSGGFGGPDIHFAVDLHGIGADALSAFGEGVGEIDGEAGLTACGRTENEDNGLFGVHDAAIVSSRLGLGGVEVGAAGCNPRKERGVLADNSI